MHYGANQIIMDILISVSSEGGSYWDWYAGVTNNPPRRLFLNHNLNQSTGPWRCWHTQTADVARNIEDFLVNVLGFAGGTGGGDETAKFVYVYKKTSQTRD
jgi:hypothetical protein